MQSATSFFNRALFRKNLQRFWPLWLGYVLIWLLLLPLRCSTSWPTITVSRPWPTPRITCCRSAPTAGL